MKRKQIIEATEYEKIVCQSNKFDKADEYQYLPEKTYLELERFIKDFTNEYQGDASDFFKLGFNRRLGNYVTVQNHVGLIELKSGYQIQIMPKLDLGETGDETKEIFGKMLRSLKDFPAKVSNEANLETDRMNLYEVFIDMYIQDVQQLVKHGIKSSYLNIENNLGFYKGKLLVNQHIKENLSHKERFYVAYDEYFSNRPENRIIKSTLIKLASMTRSDVNQKKIKQLLSMFEDVEESVNYEKDFAKVVLDRNMKDYERLVKWSKVFLLNKSFKTFKGNTEARALLFPMEKIFEEYVAKELKKVIKGNWTLSAQDSRFYLFDEPKIFKLRPDIVLKNKNGAVIVMDTKWKKLVNDSRCNYGIAQADMYQMYAYSKKYNSTDIWLLYPESPDMNNSTKYLFESLDNEIFPTRIHLFFVNLKEIEKSMEKLFEEATCYDVNFL
ncbi:MAG: McrC family protein [Lachnospiraceae bacterium]|nr:McrC family protein [Lachnospiraceae bacterium]